MYMVEIGEKVRFVPSFVPKECNFSTAPNEYVKGKVVYVNHNHKYFTAEYGWEGSLQRESFKFSQIGKDVLICG